jgi:hypothetical protein
MRILIILIAGSFLLTACGPQKKEIIEGKSLFNGKNLDGWRFYKDKENNSWEVAADGSLHCKPFDGNEKRANLITADQYENFELNWEWKISAQGNSGVMFRVTEEYDEPYLSGPEYQLLDDIGYPGKIEDWQKTAADYGMYTAPSAKTKSVGEWNTSKIVVNVNHVEYWLNDAKVVEYELGSEDWQKRKAASKWNEAVGYGAAKKGHICLQDHGGEVWFRNIVIKALDSPMK